VRVEMMVWLGASFWIAMMLVAVSLCRTAKTGDDQMLAALAHQGLGDSPMALIALGATEPAAGTFDA
jgi:hypothetical protein